MKAARSFLWSLLVDALPVELANNSYEALEYPDDLVIMVSSKHT